MLLTYAEAKVELDQIDASVYDAINEVLQCPDVSMPLIAQSQTQAGLREIVRHERWLNWLLKGSVSLIFAGWALQLRFSMFPLLTLAKVQIKSQNKE